METTTSGRLESHFVSVENNTSAIATKTSADDGGGEESCKKNSGWESLELCVLERITRSLSVTDLCKLSQVSKHYRDLCGREEVWNSRSQEEIKDQLLLLNRKSLDSVLVVVPKQLVLQLTMHAEKNGGLGGLQQLPPPLELLHQVTVEGVHGVLRRSLDGDFIINHKESGNCLGTKVEFPYNGEVELSADVVCSTEDLTKEEMAEALQEAAVLTLLKSYKCSENNIIMTTTIATTTKLNLSLQSCS
ncbi:unnamed protein product [Sphagnum balticum]